MQSNTETITNWNIQKKFINEDQILGQIKGLVSLDDYVTHGDSQIRSERPLAVQTPPSQWQFGVVFPLRLEKLRSAGNVALLVRIRCLVLSGEVGIGGLAPNDQDIFLERKFSASKDYYDFNLFLSDPLGNVGGIVFRNTALNQSSVFEVLSLQAYELFQHYQAKKVSVLGRIAKTVLGTESGKNNQVETLVLSPDTIQSVNPSRKFAQVSITGIFDHDLFYSALRKAWGAVIPNGVIQGFGTFAPDALLALSAFCVEHGVKYVTDDSGFWQITIPETKECAENIASALREKWRQLPISREERGYSNDLLNLKDSELLEKWLTHKEETSVFRGWYQQKYKNIVNGKNVLDFGSGFSVDGLFFAENGAKVTCADIVRSNLEVVKRVSALKQFSVDTYLIEDFFKFEFQKKFDVMMFLGSILHAPFSFAQREIQALLPFIEPDGTILVLGYPKERYVRLGAKNLHHFGKMTDGDNTPWAEWFDREKIESLFPGFQVVFEQGFGQDNIEFIFFELKKKQKV